MTRRFHALATAVGLASVLTIAPALAADPAPDDKTPPGATCAPTDKTSVPAPPVGTQETYQAGDAGSVVVQRTSDIELSVVSATPNAGWANGSQTPTGSRVAARFYQPYTTKVVRFVAELNRTGTSLYVRVTRCEKSA